MRANVNGYELPKIQTRSVIVEVLEVRAYQVEARSADEAMELVRNDRQLMTYDIINDEIQNITVEEE